MRRAFASRRFLFSTMLCLFPMAVGLALYQSLPPLLPIHWGFSGLANGYGWRSVAVFVYPLSLTALNALLHALLRGTARAEYRILSLIACWAAPAASLCFGLMSIVGVLYPLSLLQWVPCALGLLLIAFGSELSARHIPLPAHAERARRPLFRVTVAFCILGGFAALACMFTSSVWVLPCALALTVLPPAAGFLLALRKS